MLGLDNLRFIMVVFVIGLHAAMTYMEYVPEWWYVIDKNQSLGFTVLVVILDSFPMTVMFFLAGYFALPSLAKRGKNSFIYDKFMHIGLPWILGVLLVAPFFSRASVVALGYPSTPILEYVTHSFFGPAYQQAHYWFLGVLFFFLVVYGLISNTKQNNENKPESISPAWMIFLVIIITCVTYFLSSSYYKPVNDWSNISYILYFQPARIIGYAAMFFLGVYGNKYRWFTKEGWVPEQKIFVPIAVLSLLFLVYWKFIWAPTLSESLNGIINAVSYSLTSVIMTFALISIFLKTKPKFQETLSFFTPYSYGIYWLHQIILMSMVYALLDFNFPPVIKWTLAVLITVLICTLLTRHILKKVPFFKKIF